MIHFILFFESTLHVTFHVHVCEKKYYLMMKKSHSDS